MPFSYQITGNAAPSSFGAIGLPSWLSVNTTTGAITGTPPGGGTFAFTPTATNYAGTGSVQVVLTVTSNVANAPSFGTLTPVNGTAGTPFTYNIAAANSPTNFSALLLPRRPGFRPEFRHHFGHAHNRRHLLGSDRRDQFLWILGGRV